MSDSNVNPYNPYARSALSSLERHEVPRWHTETPYFMLALLIAIPMWILLVVSIIGLVYGLMIFAFIWLGHVLFVGHVRANGVQLGTRQMPELYERVCEIARAQGLEEVPDVYVMQAGGLLNALATKFLGRKMVVLFSDLVEACGENTAARDMIIGHELGHIRAGHLSWQWLIAPGLLLPFLGAALSRAREYTCDRYGLRAAGDLRSAEMGLTILAVGGRLAHRVDREQFLEQQRELRGFWMGIAKLMATHPPLMKRIEAVAKFAA
jgi:Zn-dependent protease with chaperone function